MVGNPLPIMINETFAKKYFPGRNPIGLHVGFGSDPGTPTDMEIIGVVKDIKYTNLRDEIPPQAFIPYMAAATSAAWSFTSALSPIPIN